MLQEVRTEESRPVPGGRIFAHPMRFEEKPWRKMSLRGVMRLMAIEVEEWREAFGGERCERLQDQGGFCRSARWLRIGTIMADAPAESS